MKQRFQPKIGTFCHFRTGPTGKCTSLYKTAFSARDQHVLSFLHWAHHFLVTLSKVHEFVLKSGVLSAIITQHADLELKTLFCTNWCTLLKTSKQWCAECETDKTC